MQCKFHCDLSTTVSGSQLVSDDGAVKLTMQEDGDLVLSCTNNGKALWTSGTGGKDIDGGLYIQVDLGTKSNRKFLQELIQISQLCTLLGSFLGM